jgi:hypothetical protein
VLESGRSGRVDKVGGRILEAGRGAVPGPRAGTGAAAGTRAGAGIGTSPPIMALIPAMLSRPGILDESDC